MGACLTLASMGNCTTVTSKLAVAIQGHRFAITMKDLIDQVTIAFNKNPPNKIKDGFITLQSCLEEILKPNRSNLYKISHMKNSVFKLKKNHKTQYLFQLKQ